MVDGERAGGEDADGLIAYLIAVAVGAVDHAVSPVLGQAGHLGRHIAQDGGHQNPARRQGAAVGQGDGEPQVTVRGGGGGSGHGDVPEDDLAAVLAYLPAPALEDLGGGVPSRTMEPCLAAAGALPGVPLSITTTERRERAGISAPFRPAAPPPITTTSMVSVGSGSLSSWKICADMSRPFVVPGPVLSHLHSTLSPLCIKGI